MGKRRRCELLRAIGSIVLILGPRGFVIAATLEDGRGAIELALQRQSGKLVGKRDPRKADAPPITITIR